MNRFCRTIAISYSIITLSQYAQADMINENKEYDQKKQYHKNRKLLVKYKEPGLSVNNKAHFSAGAYVVKSFTEPNIDVVEVAKGISIKAAIKSYEKNPNVEYVEPDYELKAFFTPPPFLPPETPKPPVGGKDPNFNEQWGLSNSGQKQGKVDADINAPEAWKELTDNQEETVIAVIDTGININHDDLKHKLWVNTEEIPNNGIDDDNNGVIDDIYGFNAANDNGDPNDDHGHGSHCSGIIAAESENAFGGKGVSPNTKIIGCKFLDSSGSGSTSDAIECMYYVLDLTKREKNPVKVLATSNSWGGSENSQALRDAIKAHEEAGILFIAAASNDYSDNDAVATYPADYDVSNVISVAASNRFDAKSDFSNYGSHTVHVAAPGEEIFSTVLDNKYDTWDGTSMATPFVSGLAALIKMKYPEYDYKKIKNLIISSGTPLDSMKDLTISGRRIRAFDTNGQGALSCKDQVVTKRLTPIKSNFLTGNNIETVFSVVNINCENPNGEVTISDSNGASFRLLDDGTGPDQTENDGVYTGLWSSSSPGNVSIYFPNDDVVIANVYDSEKLKPYTFKEDDFNYRNISGTNLHLSDDSEASFESTFPINFGGYENFTTIHISSNGALSFSEDQNFSFENINLPVSGFSTFVSPYWDDRSEEHTSELQSH